LGSGNDSTQFFVNYKSFILGGVIVHAPIKCINVISFFAKSQSVRQKHQDLPLVQKSELSLSDEKKSDSSTHKSEHHHQIDLRLNLKVLDFLVKNS
jgi:hypothetical protein